MKRQSRDRVHEHRLAEGRPRPRAALEIDGRLHVDERERDELGEAARPLLEVAHGDQMPRPASRAFDRPEHDRRRRAQAGFVRGLVHLEPLLGRDLVRAEDPSHLVVEDLGGRAREGREAGVAQAREVVGEREPERRSSLPDLERREGVHVQIGQLALDRLDDLDVVVAGERGVDPALQADLDGAALPRLAAAADDLVERDEVGRAAQVLGQLPLRKGAKAAAEVADVGVVDVARDDVGDLVAVRLAPQLVGGCEHRRRARGRAPGRAP